jgi:hypothetical protein
MHFASADHTCADRREFGRVRENKVTARLRPATFVEMIMPERERRPQPGRETACQICNAAPPERARPSVPGRRTLEATNIARRDNFAESVATTPAAPATQQFEPADD